MDFQRRGNFKQLLGLIGFAFGIGLIIYAVHSMQKIAAAKENVHGISSWFAPTNLYGQFFSGILQKKASQYDTAVLWLLIAGVVLLIIGAGVIFLFRNRKK